jgi:nitrate/nitrite transporter NarK
MLLRPQTPRAWAVFILASFAFFLSQFYRAANAVISPELLVDLALDTKGLGLLSAWFFYAFAVTQIPITLFLDRVGPRRMMSGLMLVGIAGALVFSMAEDLNTGIAGRILMGAGMSCNLMGTLKLLTLWFSPHHFATLSGVVFAIGALGNMAATSPFVLMVERMGWRSSFQRIAAFNLLVVIFFFLLVRENPASKPPKEEGIGSNLRLLLRHRDFWIISAVTMVSYGVFGAFQTLWAGPFLIEAVGITPLNAGHLILLINVAAILAGPAWGYLSDRLRTRKWIVFGGHACFALATLLMIGVRPGIGTVSLAVLFFSFGFFRTTASLLYTQIKESMPVRMAGTAMTGINFFTMLGPAVFLHGLGKIMQNVYPTASLSAEAFHLGFILCASAVGAIVILYLLTKDGGSQAP